MSLKLEGFGCRLAVHVPFPMKYILLHFLPWVEKKGILTSRREVFQSSRPWQPGPPHRRSTREAGRSWGHGEERDKQVGDPLLYSSGWCLTQLQHPMVPNPRIIAPSQSCTRLQLCAQVSTQPHPHPVPLLCAHSFQVSGWSEVASDWSAPDQG